ncbi:MAG: hypothetical protein KC419_27085 [Anaerolineales bacterium]|nr:hypothetical protein [Anaerolineales bacterium]
MTKKRNDLAGGIVLIGLGLLFLVGRIVNLDNWGLLFLPALGAIFMIWGILAREGGLMIPGGIISGIGWGSYLIAGPWALDSALDDGGLFMIVFGIGFMSITLFSLIFAHETHWWALIPGGIISGIGAAIMFGGVFMQALELLGTYWPVILILVGIYVIFQAGRGKIIGKE